MFLAVSVFNRRSVCLTEDEGGLGEADETVLLQPGAEIEVKSLQTQIVRRSLFGFFFMFKPWMTWHFCSWGKGKTLLF